MNVYLSHQLLLNFIFVCSWTEWTKIYRIQIKMFAFRCVCMTVNMQVRQSRSCTYGVVWVVSVCKGWEGGSLKFWLVMVVFLNVSNHKNLSFKTVVNTYIFSVYICIQIWYGYFFRPLWMLYWDITLIL
jgi:hypothetical protein